MRILLVNDVAGPEGGAELTVLRVASLLRDSGHVVAGAFTTGSAEAVAPHFDTVFFADSTPDPRRKDATAPLLADAVDRFAPDAVFVHNLLDASAVAPLTERAPVIRFVHDERVTCLDRSRVLPWPGSPVCERRLATACVACRAAHVVWEFRHSPHRIPGEILASWPRLQRARRGLALLGDVEHVLVPSRFLRDMLVRHGITEESVTVATASSPIPSTEPPRPVEAPDRYVLFAGRLDRHKGVHQLVRAMALLPRELSLVMCGAGLERERLGAAVLALGLQSRVHWQPWLDASDLAGYYAHAEVVAVPSTWPEPLGKAGVEALAWGRPVVGTDVGGIPEWLRDGVNGLLVPRADVQSLASAIRSIIEDPGRAAAMGAAGRALFETEFAPDRFDDTIASVLEAAVESWWRRRERRRIAGKWTSASR